MPYGGHPGCVEDLATLAAQHDLPLLIDAARAIGSRIGRRRVSSLGSGSAFSFLLHKNLAIGEGGMVVTSDPEVADRIRLLRSHWMTTSPGIAIAATPPPTTLRPSATTH